MKKTVSLLSVLALGACVYGTPVNNEGFYTEMDLTTVDWSEVNKSGSSCQTNLFFIIPFGDNSVPSAIKSAKIKKVSYIDTDYALYFPLLSRECTNVWGVGDVTMDLPNISDYSLPKPTKSKKSEKAASTEKTVTAEKAAAADKAATADKTATAEKSAATEKKAETTTTKK